MPEQKSKPRLALFGMGTLDAGNLGVPVMIDLFGRLSAHYDIVFYSFLPIDDSLVPPAIVVKQPFSLRLPGRVKYFLVAVRCLFDHVLNPFSLLFAVSIYPTGRWAVALSKLINRPVLIQLISTEGGTSPEISFGNLTMPWLKKMTLDVCKKADVVAVVADYQKKFAVQNLQTQKEIAVLPLRINTWKFIYRERFITFPVQFIQIAFYSPLKDQDTLFASFAQIARKIDCHLTVVGEGFDTPKIHSMMNDLAIKDKVTFTGFVQNDELPKYLDKSHILLHTALFETGCAVIQEAMASGVVVCGTNVGILFDIGDDYAVTVPIRHSIELADKILDLISDPVRYQNIRNAAYKFITTYDAVWSYKNYKTSLDGMLDDKNKNSIQA